MEIQIGTQYINRKGFRCTVSDIWKTYNAAGKLVQTRYVATHEFCGQPVTERDVLDVTIQKALAEAVCSTCETFPCKCGDDPEVGFFPSKKREGVCAAERMMG